MLTSILPSLRLRHDKQKNPKNCEKQECGLSCINTKYTCLKPRGARGSKLSPDGGRIRTARPDLTQKGKESLIPTGLKKHLSDHQRQGVSLGKASMDANGAFLLADSTGVGKTRQELALAKMYADEGKRVLIVTKSSILQADWDKNKINGGFGEDAKKMAIGVRLADTRSKIRKGQVAITSYERFDRLAAGVDKNTVVIMDEAHSFKNKSSKRTRLGMNAIARADKVLYATATPIDKIEHMDYLGRLGVFGDRTGRQFRKFAKSNDPDAMGLQGAISSRFDELTKKGMMIRRELSLKDVNVEFKKVSVPARGLADLKKTRSTYTNNADRAQQLMTQRRQLEPYKVPAAAAEVKKALKGDRQVIVFASRVNDSQTPSGISAGTVGALRKELAKSGITDVAELHGNSKTKGPQVVSSFQSSKAKVLITTLQSGGTGINLDDTAGDKPRTIVMMTPPFSAVENVQAVGRVWRYGTKSRPDVKYLFTDTAIDQWNQEIISTKMKTLEANVQGEVRSLRVPAA